MDDDDDDGWLMMDDIVGEVRWCESGGNGKRNATHRFCD
jgi:hypothetical protein